MISEDRKVEAQKLYDKVGNIRNIIGSNPFYSHKVIGMETVQKLVVTNTRKIKSVTFKFPDIVSYDAEENKLRKIIRP